MCACACVHCWLGKCDVLCIQVLLAGNNETSEKWTLLQALFWEVAGKKEKSCEQQSSEEVNMNKTYERGFTYLVNIVHTHC